MNQHPSRAFSLIEVIIAVGLFAASVTVALALLPALARHGAAVQDTLTAQRLPDALKAELQRLAAAGGVDSLAAEAPVMGTPPGDGLALVASRDASRLHSRDYLPPTSELLAEGDRYFLLECWRFPDEPLRHDPQKHFLALGVRVSWPYRLPGIAGPTAPGSRTLVVYTVSIVR